MATIHIVSHTHWDREWYLTYQQFRLKLVAMLDDLLAILDHDPLYRCFLLDGQMILLEDYLEIRPHERSHIQSLVQAGRLHIGPWYVMPDEFLVAPESIIRNLLEGDRLALSFGKKMEVGYTPDPFGHIGQLPQILTGFGIESASAQRGLSDEPCEFWWGAPDGSRVLMAYLRDGYENASALPTRNPPGFLEEVKKIAAQLDPFCITNQRLLMHGSDHMHAQPDTSTAIGYAQENQGALSILHSNLPAYVRSVKDEIAARRLQIPTLTGELRSSKRHNLLPGVLSTRVWIKQRNHACETLMTKWVEPFQVLLEWAKTNPPTQFTRSQEEESVKNPAEILKYAWRLLMQCHFHDSICGSSIDQVHEEMKPRFDQVEQIGEELTRQSLADLTSLVDTTPPEPLHALDIIGCIQVFNPNGIPCRGEAKVKFFPSGSQSNFGVIDQRGSPVPFEILGSSKRKVAELDFDRTTIFSMVGNLQNGELTRLAAPGMTLQDIRLEIQGETVSVIVSLSETAPADPGVIERLMPMATAILRNESIRAFHVLAEIPSTEIVLLPPEVPAYGFLTCWIVRTTAGGSAVQETQITKIGDRSIENEFLRVTANESNGTLDLFDRRTRLEYPGLNRFVDSGDCGDEYNYCPPLEDHLLSPARVSVRRELHPTRQTLVLDLEIEAPTALMPDRKSRQSDTRPIKIRTTASLLPGVPILDIHSEVENTCEDHRLRVHFPAPFLVSEAEFDGAFDLDSRSIQMPVYDASWTEAPRPEKPQRDFTALMNESRGLLIANRGLYEAEALINAEGNSEIALTLLRCVGWLSRDDFALRKGHAGPELPVPGAQMLGRWSFDYAVLPFVPQQAPHAYQLAHACNAPLRAIPSSLHGGSLPHTLQFIASEPELFIISALKGAEDSRGWILRGYNPSDLPLKLSLRTFRNFAKAELANLTERALKPLSFDPNTLSLEYDVAPHQIVTIKFLA